jgi:hypothetical protein
MLYWKQSNLFLPSVIQKNKQQRESMDCIFFVLLKHFYFLHPVVLQHQGIGTIHKVTSQYSNQLHSGHITAGNNKPHSSNNNRGFNYVVIHTHDKLPSQITTTTQLTLHHTLLPPDSNNYVLVYYVTSTIYKILNQHCIAHLLHATVPTILTLLQGTSRGIQIHQYYCHVFQ